MDALDLKNFCITDEELAADRLLESAVPALVRVAATGTEVPVETSLRFLPCFKVLTLNSLADGFRRDSESALNFETDATFGLEVLVMIELPVVADIGRRGGIASWRVVLLLSGCFSVLELLRFHERLNFLLNELIDEGVGGSSGLGCCTGDFDIDLVGALNAPSLGIDFEDCRCARGPDGLVCDTIALGVSSELRSSLPVCDLLKYRCSNPSSLGTEEERKGETESCLVLPSADSELLVSASRGLSC